MRQGWVWLFTDPVDPLRETCIQLAGYLPVLEQLSTRPDVAVSAVRGMSSRPAAAPLPGNPPAFFAYTAIWASARWAEGLLLYAVGATTRDEVARGGSDANTARLLLEVIPRLVFGVDDETYGVVLRELDRRLNEARSVRAIDEAELWRPVRSRPCPFCHCFFLRVLLDAAKRPTGHVRCFGHAEPGVPCRAAWASLAEIVPDLARADALAGTAPDVDR